jgi:aminopeptidase 2
VIKFFETAANADQRNSALRTLGQARDPALTQRTIDLLLSGRVRDQDIYLPIGGLRATKGGIEALWAWLTGQWDAIYTKFPATSTMIGGIVGSSTGSLTTPAQLEAVLAFFEGKDKAGYDRSLAQNLDSIRAKIAWVQRDDADVRAWLGM